MKHQLSIVISVVTKNCHFTYVTIIFPITKLSLTNFPKQFNRIGSNLQTK